MSNGLFAIILIVFAIWVGVFVKLKRRGGSLVNIFVYSLLLPIVAFVFLILSTLEIISEFRHKFPLLVRPYYFAVILLCVVSLYPYLITNLYDKCESDRAIKTVFSINKFVTQGKKFITTEFKSNLPARIST